MRRTIAIDATLLINNKTDGTTYVEKKVKEAFDLKRFDDLDIRYVAWNRKEQTWSEITFSAARRSFHPVIFCRQSIAVLYKVLLLPYHSTRFRNNHAMLHAKYYSFYRAASKLSFCQTLATAISKTNKIAHISFQTFAATLNNKVPHVLSAFDFAQIDIFFHPGASWNGGMFELVQAKEKYRFLLHCILYDIIPARYPHLQACQHEYKQYLQHLISYCDKIYAISDYVRQDFLAYSKEISNEYPETNITTITLGSESNEAEILDNQQNEILAKYNITPNQYAIIVCTIEPRKNHRLLLNIWRKMYYENINCTFPLIIVGGVGWNVSDLLTEIANDNNLRNLIILTHSISGCEKLTLLKNARFSLFPSYCEGWGLPVTESLRVGTPVISSDNTSMPEVGQGLTEMIDVMDGKKWYETIIEYIKNDGLIAEKRHEISKATFRTWGEFGDDIVSAVLSESA